MARPHCSQVKLASTFARAASPPSVERGADRVRQRGRVVRRDEAHPAAAGRDLLRARLAARADRGHAAGHRLDVGDAERLLGAGQDEDAGAARLGERLVGWERAAELDPRVDAELRREPLERRAARARRRRSRSGVPGAASARAGRRRGACARSGCRP